MSDDLGNRGGGWTDEARERRFWSRVNKTSTCWLWTGATSRGYGVVTRYGRRIRVHRFIYEQTIGPIPDDKVIDHICRVRHCVNPDHLRLLTSVENVMIGESPIARNARKTHCVRGHPLSGDNLAKSVTKFRRCVQCARAQSAARWGKGNSA